ncbi:MAG: hypothetical protein LBR10_11195 [Prevotellaceae bacterium]|nr:hypothetical protein [Prevotellaceae bacterium]
MKNLLQLYGQLFYHRFVRMIAADEVVFDAVLLENYLEKGAGLGGMKMKKMKY